VVRRGITLAMTGDMADRNANEKSGPLDGSTSGTIGGGGRETGGPTERPRAPEVPAVKPENAASGRRAPDPIGATAEPDELGPGPSDVSQR
jgi:hypothetical protein